MNLIEVRDLVYSYDTENNALNGVSFDIKAGDYVTIIGHNGSGKSTLAKLLAGLLEAKSGTITIDGLLLNEENLYKIREKLGIVFQNPDNQFIGSTVKDDIAFGLENHQVPSEEMDSIILEYATKVGLAKYLEKEPTALSGGQKQRVAIAGVMAMHPNIIIFDEATSMLDPKGTREIIDMIKLLKSEYNKTIITITHNLEEATFADRVIVLNNGSIVLDGTPEEVLKEKNILEASGLKLLDSLALIEYLKNKNFSNKEEVLKQLWELTFKK